MRSTTALRIYVSLLLTAIPAAADGDSNWHETRSQALRAFRENQYQIAETLFRRSREQAHQPDEQATSDNDLGVLLHLQARDKEASVVLARSFRVWEQLGRNDEAVRTAHSLGTVLRANGEYQEAEKVLRRALDSGAGDAKDRALAANTLADMLREQGQFTESRAFAEIALGTPGVPWRTTINATVTIADLDRESHQFEASIQGWTKALTEAREQHDSVIEAVALRGLGETFLMKGERASAEPSLRKALAYFEGVHNGHQMASTLTCLADLYITEGKPAMAEDALRRAVELDETAIGPTHPQIAVMLQMRADAEVRLGAVDRAKADMDRAWNILKARFGDQSPVAGAYFTNLGLIEQKSGHNADAAADFEKAEPLLRGGGSATLHVRSVMMEHYASVLKALHRKDQARAVQAQVKGFRQ